MNVRIGSDCSKVAMSGLLSLFCLSLNGCAPGYVKASDLEQLGQGPSACAKSCADLGMRMVAMVLVGDTLPGCVCQVIPLQGQPPPGAAGQPNPDSAAEGAAATTAGYVVLAAAAAAREQQEQIEHRERQEERREQGTRP